MTKRLAILYVLVAISAVAGAQKNATDMADTMRSNGKIYVVVAIILTIFAGIVFYLIRLERKIKKLESSGSG